MLNDKLNVLLANYAVEAHKIHNFHWYVSGPSFYNVHTDLDEVYGAMYNQLCLACNRQSMLVELITGINYRHVEASYYCS